MDAAQAAAVLDRLVNLEQHAHATEGRFANLAPAARKPPSLKTPERWNGKGDVQLEYILPMRNWVEHHQIADNPSCLPHLLSNLPPLLQL